MKFSILDVAQKAGVSKSTVSRVINGGSVSKKSSNAVLNAIKELDFHPNYMAQGLRGAKSKVIGLVIFGVNAFLNRYIPIRLAGMNSVFLESGYSVLLINLSETDSNSLTSYALQFLKENRVDGLIFLNDIDDECERQDIQNYHEIVYTGERINLQKGFRVYMGNYNYSRDLYYYLAVNGHSHILTLFEHDNILMQKRRFEAYSNVCSIFHFSLHDNCIINLYSNDMEQSCQLEDIYQKFTTGRYTAIFADSIEFANILINYFFSKGLFIVQDYSIVAIERETNIVKRDVLITSICLQDYEYGVKSAQMLMEILNNPELTYKDISIPYTLKIGKSVKNISDLEITD